MKRIIRGLAILAAVICVSCMHSKESSFFRKFSLNELVVANQSHLGLDCVAAGGGGGGSRVWSLGPTSREFHSSKSEGCYCKLESDAIGSFSESDLIDGLAGEVERVLGDSGAKIIDKGKQDSRSFYFEYALEDAKGRVEISIKRMLSDQYSFAASLEEGGKN